MKGINNERGFLSIGAGFILFACFLYFSGERPLSAREATPPSPEKKIKILADKLIFERENNIAEFAGNVTATENGTVLKADKMQIHFANAKEESHEKSVNSKNIKEIHATGHVNITFDDTIAVSENAVYVVSENTLILTGKNTMLTRGGNAIVGNKISIFRDDGRISVEGDSKNRVHAEFFPDDKQETEKQ